VLFPSELRAGGAPVETSLIFQVAAHSWFLEGAEGFAKELCAQGDGFRTSMRDFVASLPELEFLAGLSF
jgi:hypothetical protein